MWYAGRVSDDVAGDLRSLLSLLVEQMPMSDAEFRYRVEPLRVEREQAVRALVEWTGEETAFGDLAAAALHEIALPSDADFLADMFRDPRRSTRSRAEIGQVLAAVGADRLASLLSAEDIHSLSMLSIDTLLQRMRTRPGLNRVLELYRGSSTAERRALLETIGIATRSPGTPARLGMALDPLFSIEDDAALRGGMIRKLSQRREAASVRALSRWLGETHGTERRRVLEALRRLGSIAPRTSQALEAWISGVDLTGSFNVGVSFPAALDLRDLVLACISVESGLRAVNVLTAASADTAREIRRALEEGQAIPVVGVDVPAALRQIEQARRRVVDAGRPLPDGYALAARYLRRPLGIAKPAVTASASATVSSKQLAALVEAASYRTWVLGETDLGLSDAPLRDEPLSPRRLRALARSSLYNLERTPAAARLIAMLKHQAEVHARRSETQLADRSFAAAREIEQRGASASRFVQRLVDRSVVAWLVQGTRTPRTEVREAFKQRLEDGFALRRRAVAILDLAEALFRQLENLAERTAPSTRLPLPQMEAVALAAGELCVEEFTRSASEQAQLPGMETPPKTSTPSMRRQLRDGSMIRSLERGLGRVIAEIGGASSQSASAMAAAMARTAQWFAEEVCLRRCRRGCLLEPEADGRAMFFSRRHPAGLDTSGGDREAGDADWPERLALREHLSRGLDERIAAGANFLSAFDQLGVPARGETRGRADRAREVVERLRRSRRNLDRIDQDPGWLYATVDENGQLVRELGLLCRDLLGTALRALTPGPEQFAGFEPDTAALVSWRRVERYVRKLGLMGIPLRSLHAAVDRVDGSAAIIALLHGASGMDGPADPKLSQALREFWTHTPRSSLGGQTPARDA